MSTPHPYVAFEGTPHWTALDAAVRELVANNDVKLQTDSRYVVGSLCKALTPKTPNGYKPKHIGHFILTGDFDPDAITRLLGIEPSWIHRKGGLMYADAHGPSKVSAWAMYCSPDAGGDVQDQIFWLLFQLREQQDVVKELCKRFDGQFNVYALLDGSFTGFWLPPDQLQRLADLGIHLECEYIYDRDLYFDDYFAEGRNPISTEDNPELIAAQHLQLEKLNKKEAE